MSNPQMNTIKSLDGAIITKIVLVDKITRLETGPFKSASLPGHLIHIVTEGEVEQESCGIVQRYRTGDTVWYWENEMVQGRIIKAPFTFYTVSFSAPSLPPPPLNERIKPYHSRTINHVRDLLQLWKNREMPPIVRHIRLHVLLLEVVMDLLSETVLGQSVEKETALWWKLEAALRQDLSRSISSNTLCQISHRSQRSIFRACQKATGLSPMKRIKQLRLSYARGLLQFSSCPVSEIAYDVGYTRVQEFSRDYKKYFGCTPTADRTDGSDYRQITQRRIGPFP